MQRVIGIDLGTTNACVAVVEGGVPKVIPNKGGYKTTPAIVGISDSARRFVGQMAKRQAITNARHTVYAAKRLIGRKWDTDIVQHSLETCPYELVEGPHGDVRIKLRNKVYSIPEISSIILQEMKLIAEEYLDSEIAQAVITVPAYFNDAQRQATKDAGRIAGLDVLRIINEPTAASLAYGYNREDLDARIAIYDLGGGTFDISILEVHDSVFDVISTGGDTYLGGEDFDARIIEWLLDEFLEEFGFELERDGMALQRLKDAAEQAKIELSGGWETEINLPFLCTVDGGEALHLQRIMTRDVLEDLVADLVERTLFICEETLARTDLAMSDIDEVILVGGMTRMPMVQASVQNFFGREPLKNVHPDEVVAMGASIMAHALVHDDEELLLLDVTPHNLGIAVYGGGFEAIIHRDSTVPISRSRVFTTHRDNRTSVKILVLQGDSHLAEENEVLGEFILTGLRPAPAGEVQIEVEFEITADGIAQVAARDVETGRAQSITVNTRIGLPEEEIAAIIAEQQDYPAAFDDVDVHQEEFEDGFANGYDEYDEYDAYNDSYGPLDDGDDYETRY